MSNSLKLATLPGDEIRQYLWRYHDRFDLQMLIQASRAVARTKVAPLVAEGERSNHEWTAKKADLLSNFDESGITSAFMDPEQGGYIEGPKNMALGLIAFELSWVDAGAATGSLAGNLALSPIHEKGTLEQRDHYLRRAVPANSIGKENLLRGAFCLTEPLPYVGVDTGMVSGKVRISEWQQGKEPILEVEKRGRFITNMGFANFVTAAVVSDDQRIKGSCMVILEEGDPGTFDRGSSTRKFVHQMSSTNDPVFKLRVPASRIIGGYQIKDNKVIPNFDHGEIIEAVFKRTRVTVALMTPAKLLSSLEPIIRYQRTRFRGSSDTPHDSPRYQYGLQHKEDALHRLLDIWATGEAGASLGFSAARIFDKLDPLEREKDRVFKEQGIVGRAQLKVFRQLEGEAIKHLENAKNKPLLDREESYPEDLLTKFLLLDSVANVYCPAAKLWNTGHGANMMREAVSLMGGYGITEDCPGNIGFKWIDSQLEATYEGPECVQRRQLSLTMTNKVFLYRVDQWIKELEEISEKRQLIGPMALSNSIKLWQFILHFTENNKDANGNVLYNGNRQGVCFSLADALCWIISARQFFLDVLYLEKNGKKSPILSPEISSITDFYFGLCSIHAAKAVGEVNRISAEIFYGYQKENKKDDIVVFQNIKQQAESGLYGVRLLKDELAAAVLNMTIPEALDY